MRGPPEASPRQAECSEGTVLSGSPPPRYPGGDGNSRHLAPSCVLAAIVASGCPFDATFVLADTNTATIDEAGLLTWATGPQLPVDEAALLGRLMFRVVPVGENEVAPAEIATDYVELTMSYRLP